MQIHKLSSSNCPTSSERRSPRRLSLSRLAALGSIPLALSLAVAGCGDDDDDDADGGMAGMAMPSAGSGGMGMGGSAMAGAGMGGTGGMGMDPTASSTLANGLSLPMDIMDWAVLGGITRGDNDQVRVVVGNDVAVEAARAANGQPVTEWPDGSMIADYVWEESTNPLNPTGVLIPNTFSLVALMVKDSAAYADDGGWAYGAWLGEDLAPIPATTDSGAPFDQGCIDCHTNNASGTDYVFTVPGQLPAAAAFAGADDASNGVSLPADFANWRVLGLADRTENNQTFRVLVGNDLAVDAARAANGRVDEWPEGSQIGHFVWAPGTNEATDDALSAAAPSVVPGEFQTVTLMEKDSTRYAADGNWAYGAWSGLDLTAAADNFDQGCINCHTENVVDQDMVFTIPAMLPTP